MRIETGASVRASINLTKLAKAKADLARIRPLAEMNAISQVDLDGAIFLQRAHGLAEDPFGPIRQNFFLGGHLFEAHDSASRGFPKQSP